MASKRTLKKTVNYIAGELFTECVVLKEFMPNIDNGKVDELMAKVLYLQNEFLSRINHPEPGNIKGSYKKLRTDLASQVNALVTEIRELH